MDHRQDNRINAHEVTHRNGWTLRYRLPQGQSPFPVFALLHGWTGDENAMWIFAPRLPQDALLLAPRGLYPSARGGYSWRAEANLSQPFQLPTLEHFRPAAEKLVELLTPQNFPMGDFGDLNVVGFSQGAALAYSYALLYPGKVASLAILSGFMPAGAIQDSHDGRVAGLPVFVTHGTRDDLVPVEYARLGVDVLQKAGAHVTYCEADVGHKLGLDCFKALERFYADTDRRKCD